MCHALVAALPIPALLIGGDLRPLAWSPSWAERAGDPGPADAPVRLPARVGAAVRECLAGRDGETVVLAEGEMGGLAEVTARCLDLGDGPAALLCGAARESRGWARHAVEAATTPTLLVGPKGRVLSANRAARALGAFTDVADLAPGLSGAPRLHEALDRAIGGEAMVVHLDRRTVRLLPVAGLALVEVTDREPPRRAPAPAPADLPEAMAFRARSDLQDIVGHLEVLRTSALSTLQKARADAALEKAIELAGYLGAPLDPDGPAEPVALRPPALPVSFDPDAVRVLVVDDNSINRHVALSMFKVLGVRADAVEDADAVLAAIAEAAETVPYDVVFMDVMLPSSSGIELTRQIRARYGDRPYVVGVTAMPGVEDECRAAGMDAFYAKPLRLREVTEAVARFAVA